MLINGEIEQLFGTFSRIDKLLSSSKDLSLIISFREDYAKYAAVCVASKLEADTKDFLAKTFAKLSVKEASDIVFSFINRNVLARGLHTIFELPRGESSPSMRRFYSNFGDDAKVFFIEQERQDNDFHKSACAFLRVWQWRNEMVHGNLAAFDPTGYASDRRNLTVEEVGSEYGQATMFLPQFEKYLERHIAEVIARID